MSRRTIRLALALAVAALLAAALPATAGPGTFTLMVTKAGGGGGSVTSDVAGIDCGATCTFDFPAGTPVTLTAVANGTSTFIDWGNDCSGSGTCQLTMNAAHTVRATFARSYRPDAWMQLCGLSDGCTINGLPNPIKGKNIYNSSGDRQTIAVKMEDGEGVRFWMTFENDGVLDDTFTVEGCKGTPRFKVNKVQVGFYKRPTSGSIKITSEFKAGNAEFDLNPGQVAKITLNIIAPTTAEGVTYICPVTIHSQGDPGLEDTLKTKMTTY